MKSRKRAEESLLNYRDAYAIMIEAAQRHEDIDREDAERIMLWEEEGEVDEAWKKKWSGITWTLRRIPINMVADKPRFEFDEDVASEYASMDASTSPPILLNSDGHPLDGQHRVRAAVLRGDEDILAWVPSNYRWKT